MTRKPIAIMIVNKGDSPLMRALALVLGRQFLTRFWTTWRLPFQRAVRIGYPAGMTRSDAAASTVVAHEMHHARQVWPWYGPLWVLPCAALLPLPVLFSGRWWIERGAYLDDIRDGRITTEQAVDVLWRAYGWCWPRPLMRRWFTAALTADTQEADNTARTDQ